MSSCDVLIVSLGSTPGWRDADAKLRDLLTACGVATELVAAEPQPRVRTMMFTDYRWAAACRVAADAGVAKYNPRAVIYSTVTASLFWQKPGAIRFDEPGALNRPGRHGLWQRRVERRRLAAAPLLIGLTQNGLDAGAALADQAGADARQPRIVLPFPITGVGEAPSGVRLNTALTYAANPVKKGIDLVIAAWVAVRKPGELLVVAGLRPEQRKELLEAANLSSLVGSSDAALEAKHGLRFTPMQPYDEYRAQLRQTRVFINAPRHEDYGITQLEALADGCQLVTTESPGSYPALAVAKEVDARLVGDDLGKQLRTALDSPLADYAQRAAVELERFTPKSVERVVREQVLPALLGS